MPVTEFTEPQKVSYGTAGGEDMYVPPILFREFDSIRSEQRRRRYVMRELIRMAEEKTLSVTDMLTQKGTKRDMVGMILKNIVIDPRDRVERPAKPHDRAPSSVTDYPIRIQLHGFKDKDGKPLKYRDRDAQRELPVTNRAKTIRFKRDLRPHPDDLRAPVKNDRTGVGLDGDNFMPSVEINVEEWVDYGPGPAVLPLWEAWICMSQFGKYCNRAPGISRQMSKWLYEEVRPKAK
jgi:hypothetical protein